MRQLVDAYLAALRTGDVQAILSLFADDAVVISPVYGTLPANDFYPKLAQDTRESTLEFKALYNDVNPGRCALHFIYVWHRADGDVVRFDCVDLFEANDDGLFTRLQIIYDTALLADPIS